MPTNALTPEEIERMRTLVAQNDAQTAVKEFDLNNPPQVPYVYQPFPTTVYHRTKGNKVVPDQEALDAALAEGWKHEPIPSEPPPELELDAATKEEAAAVDKEAKKPKR